MDKFLSTGYKKCCLKKKKKKEKKEKKTRMESLVGRNTVSHPEVSYTNPLQSTLIGTAQTVHTSVAMDGTVFFGNGVLLGNLAPRITFS